METKTCNACKISKPLNDFHKNKNLPDGHVNSCKVCATGRTKDWQERVKVEDPERYRNAWLKRKYDRYGLTKTQYNEMVAAQNGVCAVCGDAPKDGQQLCVDHDHTCCSGKRSCGTCIRGLLCHRCNTAIGLLRDDPVLVQGVAAYLSCPAGEMGSRLSYK